jgi:hypothetical protein
MRPSVAVCTTKQAVYSSTDQGGGKRRLDDGAGDPSHISSRARARPARAAGSGETDFPLASLPMRFPMRFSGKQIWSQVYRPVHVKTLRSQKLRMLLTHRKLLQSKSIAIENDLRGTLRNFGCIDVRFSNRPGSLSPD